MGRFVATFATIFVLLGAGSVPAHAQASDTELSFWESVRDSEASEELEAYLKTYPDGTFAPLARLRIERLKGTGGSEATKPEPVVSPPPVIGRAPTPQPIAETFKALSVLKT